MEESLSSFGIKPGCKLMMIGKRNSPEEESELKKLKDIEKSVEQTAKKLEKVDGELTGLKNVCSNTLYLHIIYVALTFSKCLLLQTEVKIHLLKI
uniref:BCL2 associated athanogene 1 n=1 Tax=Hucho hucho TaxID=62062 RepID=A0A4W5PN56_9TELE